MATAAAAVAAAAAAAAATAAEFARTAATAAADAIAPRILLTEPSRFGLEDVFVAAAAAAVDSLVAALIGPLGDPIGLTSNRDVESGTICECPPPLGVCGGRVGGVSRSDSVSNGVVDDAALTDGRRDEALLLIVGGGGNGGGTFKAITFLA